MQSPLAKRWLRRLLWLAGGVVVAWALAWLTFPWLIRTQLQKIATEQLGRTFTVGAVDFTPWTLEVSLTDIAVAGQDGKSPPQLQIGRLYANVELESLLRLAPVVNSLVVEAPRLRLAHLGGGKYDVDDVIARLARPAQDTGADGALKFALFNLSLTGGSFDFDDRSVGRLHSVRDLTLGIPFLSNLPSRREVKVEPRLAFSVNGSRFESSAQATPFAATRKTDALLVLRDVDLSPYLSYIPPTVPVRLQQAVLGADLQLAFEQHAVPTVTLSGSLQLAGVKVVDGSGQDLLGFDALKLVFEDLQPLRKQARITSMEWSGPRLEVRRDAAGKLNLDLAATGSAPGVAPAQRPVSAASAAAVAPGDDSGWKVEVAKLAVREAVVHWSDAAVAPAAAVLVKDVSLDAGNIHWPMRQPLELQGAATLLALHAAGVAPPNKGALAEATAAASPARVTFTGSGTDQQAIVKLSLGAVPLSLGAPYTRQFLEPTLNGQVDGAVEVHWKSPVLQLVVPSLSFGNVVLAQAAAGKDGQLASVGKIQMAQAQVDLAAQQIAVGKLAIDQTRMAVVRGEDGRWMFESWLKPVSSGAPKGPEADGSKVMAKTATPPRPGWSVNIADLSVDGSSVSYLDKAASRPVAFEVSALKLRMQNVRPDGNRPVPVQVSASIRTPRSEPGSVDFRGNLQMLPLVAQGSVVATQIPAHAFEPYFGSGLNIELLRADTSFKGEVRYAKGREGPSIKVAGDGLLEDFRANSLAAGDGGLQIAEELLNWKSLSLRGMDLALAPGSPTTVAVRETTLSDFFARVIVHENGRINLQDLVKGDAAPAPAAGTTAGAPPASAPAPLPVAASTVPPASGPLATIGPISLINGRVLFSDRFVKPNYSANLSDLTGRLSAFSSVAPQGQPQLADLELRGRAEGTASLEILGKLNPLAQPLALDVKGRVRDLELPPLSPYSVKYAGHGIERGKLSMDVAYLVLPNGQLTASNKLVLNQLTFGDAVSGAPASLPVKLAVALLADRHGVIDIDLPVSGSLNDPQFRLGPIIFKVIVNLIVKAVTAPFSLLASAFGGGGDELSTVAFAPGSAALSPEARAGLDKVAQALTERPALRMTVVGTSSLDAEREAYKRERLQGLLLAEKRRALVTSGASAAVLEAAATSSLTDAEAPVLLKEVFRRADIAKPRNLAGLVQDIPVSDMEALLLANIPVTADTMRELALQRGVVVKDYLGSRQLPVERLFLGAVKPAATDEKWSPRAELSLSNN